MKIFVITKKTLLAILGGIAAVLAAVLLAVLCREPSEETSGKPSNDDRRQNEQVLGNKAASGNVVEEYELEVFSGLMKELPVYSVSHDEKLLALTIDAAWEDDKTDFILETLKTYDIKATFFLCGFWVEDYPEMVKKISDDGHEIGNHSWTHPHMSKQSSGQIVDELKTLDDKIESITGKRSTLFRAPYGEYNDTVITTVRNAGYEVIQWDIDTVDWKPERSAETILNSVLPKLKNGSIILCHNNGYKIEQYLPTLIETALSQGYKFVTVSEMLLPGPTIIDVNGVQKPSI